MRTEQFHASSLVDTLRRRTVASMADLKEALGTEVDMTVFRKLRTLDYLTSYSHGGRYYALREAAAFDAQGLWNWRDVGFSRDGSLIDTVLRLALQSDAGALATELDATLKVQTKAPLLELFRRRRLARVRLSGLYLYCSPDARTRRQQVALRRATLPEEPFGELPRPMADRNDEVKAAIILFLSLLDEKQRRLFAGVESLRLGRGGDQRIADWTGLDVHTVAKGRHELLSGDIDPHRVRRPGAGRRAVEKKRRGSSRPSSD